MLNLTTRILILAFTLTFVDAFSLNATYAIEQEEINQVDDQGRKQGKWIVYGKDRPSKGYPEDGKIEEGSYADNRKTGLWVMYYPNGNIRTKGEFKFGRPKGEFTKYYEDGTKKQEGIFTGRSFQGPMTQYHPNGKVAVEKTFNDQGKTEGPVTHYHPNGQVEFKYETKNGVPTGKAVRYYPNGDVKEVIEYADGKMVSQEKKERVNPEYKDNSSDNAKDAPDMEGQTNAAQKKVRDGYNKTYNDNGDILQDGEFKNGKLWNGKQYIYDSDGILMKIEIYKNGKYFSDGVL